MRRAGDGGHDAGSSALMLPALAALTATVVALAPVAVAGHLKAHPAATRLGISDPAQSACVRMGRVEELVSANASYRLVLVEMAQAKDEAERAASANPTWRPLLGGVGAIDNGLKADDAEASQLGISVVRQACSGLI